jgi:hypothetical protein
MLACSLPPLVTPIPPVSSPHDVYVAADGDDTHDCLTAATACLTVTGGVGRAVAGSTVHIGAGRFTEAGLIQLTIPLTFQGVGARTVLTSRGDGLFEIQAGVDIHIQDFDIVDITAPDPSVSYAILLDGGNASLEIVRVTVQNIAGNGLSVRSGSTITVADSLFSGNATAIFNLGGLQVTNTNFQQNPRAIFNLGIAALDRVTVEGSGGPDGSIPAILNSSNLTVTHSIVSNNTADGLANTNGRASISNTSFSMNSYGISHSGGTLILQDSVIRDSNFSDGFGLFINPHLYEPAIPAFAEVSRTAILGNPTGIYMTADTTVRLENVTVGESSHAAIYNDGGELTLTYSTVANNPGVGALLRETGGGIIARNSIIALNTGGNCSGPAVSLEEANFACDDTLTAATLGLGGLVPDAGTQVYPLLAGSPAIDAATGACLGQDQRGYHRPYGSACDIGAYEFGASMAIVAETPAVIEVLTATPTPGSMIFLLDKNANCRHGPGSVYEAATSYLQGQSLTVDGRNETEPWWWQVAMPNSNQHCWVSSAAGTLDGDPNSLPVIPAPPTPTVTPKPGGGGGIDFDGDGFISDKDCNDKNAKVYPGAPETPDDKIDSNCNGNDDK